MPYVARDLDRRPTNARYWRAPALGALGGVECFHARFTTHRFAKHWHSGYALGVVVAGAERYTCNHQTWRISPMRTIVAINPGEVHDGESAAANGWRYRMIYPKAETLESVAAELTGRVLRPDLRSSGIDDPELARDFVQMHRNFERRFERGDEAGDEHGSLAGEGELLTWLAKLLRRHADLQVREESPLTAADARLRRVRELIDAGHDRNLTLDALASVAGVGRFHLLRSFTRAFGMTPHAWLIQRRVVHAQQLIDSGTSLVEAALQSGFADQSHLTNRFRRAYGLTPHEYRRGNRLRPSADA